MTLLETLILVAYFFVLSILGLLRLAPVLPRVPVHEAQGPRARSAAGRRPSGRSSRFSCPIFNEMYVVDRLIDAGLRASTIRRTGSRSRCSTTRPTRRATSPSWPCAARPRAGSTSSISTATDRTGYKAGALDAGLKVGARRVRRDLRRRLRAAAPTSCDARSRTSATTELALVQARWGHLNHDYSLLTQDSGHAARRPLRARARRPQPVGLLLQLQRHGRRLAARSPSTTPAAGSTTR